MGVAVNYQKHNASEVIDAFFENGGDFGRPFLEVPLAERISSTYSEIGQSEEPYINCLEHIDPVAQYVRPMLLVANDALRSALKSKHRPVVEQKCGQSGRTASELYVFGTAGVKPLNELVGTRVIVAELAEFTNPETLLHTSTSVADTPNWYVRTNAVLHDTAHIFKEAVITAAGASEQNPLVIVQDTTPHLPTDMSILTAKDMPKNGYVPAAEYFEKMSALHANKALRLKAFRSNSQAHLASSFLLGITQRISHELKTAYEEVLQESPKASSVLTVDVVEEMFRHVRAPIIGSFALFHRNGESEATSDSAALFVPLSTLDALKSGMSEDEVTPIAQGPNSEYASFWWQDKYHITTVPSLHKQYVWMRFDELQPALSTSDKKAVRHEIINYIRGQEECSFS